MKLLSIYKSELSQHPFPRSLESVRSLANLRGAQMGVQAAEGLLSFDSLINLLVLAIHLYFSPVPY